MFKLPDRNVYSTHLVNSIRYRMYVMFADCWSVYGFKMLQLRNEISLIDFRAKTWIDFSLQKSPKINQIYRNYFTTEQLPRFSHFLVIIPSSFNAIFSSQLIWINAAALNSLYSLNSSRFHRKYCKISVISFLRDNLFILVHFITQFQTNREIRLSR